MNNIEKKLNDAIELIDLAIERGLKLFEIEKINNRMYYRFEYSRVSFYNDLIRVFFIYDYDNNNDTFVDVSLDLLNLNNDEFDEYIKKETENALLFTKAKEDENKMKTLEANEKEYLRLKKQLGH